MASIDEVSSAIGALRAQNALILSAQDRILEDIASHRSELGALAADMRVVKKDVSEFKPVAKKVGQWEQRGLGIGVAGGFVGSWVLTHFKGWFG